MQDDDADFKEICIKKYQKIEFFSNYNKMLHVNGVFENSLRNGDVLSPVSKKRTLIKHTGCKGTIHGSGNYNKIEQQSTSQCENNGHNSTTETSPFKRVPSKRYNKNTTVLPFVKKPQIDNTKITKTITTTTTTTKSASVSSSENFSETDSLDSLGDKMKSNNDNTNRKQHDDISSRLFNNLTKSSIAKTAKMRHLDIFDVEENGWIGGLRKTENTLKDSNNSTNSPFKRNGSLRRSGGFTNEGRNSFRRRSLNRSKIKCVNYEDVVYASNYKKTNGLLLRFDKSNCFKDFKDFFGDNNSVRFFIKK